MADRDGLVILDEHGVVPGAWSEEERAARGPDTGQEAPASRFAEHSRPGNVPGDYSYFGRVLAHVPADPSQRAAGRNRHKYRIGAGRLAEQFGGGRLVVREWIGWVVILVCPDRFRHVLHQRGHPGQAGVEVAP